VLLVCGLPGAGKSTLLKAWLAERPDTERWALMVNGIAGLADADRDPGVTVAMLAGGCACCSGQVVFGVTLTRLLRGGPFQWLLIEVSGIGHPGRLVDRLRIPELASRLSIRPTVMVIDAMRPDPFFDAHHPAHQLALDQLDAARLLVINRADAVTPEAERVLCERLASLSGRAPVVLSSRDGEVRLSDALAAMPLHWNL
jgi:G3E family GTPase